MTRHAVFAALVLAGFLAPIGAKAQTTGASGAAGAAAVQGNAAAPGTAGAARSLNGAAGPASQPQAPTTRDLNVSGAGPASTVGTGASSATVTNGTPAARP